MLAVLGEGCRYIGIVDVLDNNEWLEGEAAPFQMLTDPLRSRQRVVFDDESPHPMSISPP
jgi:hypothetical protein